METKQYLLAPGATKTLDVDRFFEYIKLVEAHGDEQALYAAVAWIFRCVQIRANRISTMPHKIFRGEREVNWGIPLRRLLWQTEAALLLSGAGYWLKRPKRGELKQLLWLNPQSMEAITSEQGIKHFEQVVGGQKKTYSVDEIVYFRSWNPGDDLGPGIAPGRVALEAGGLAQNANQWASAFFEHGAIPAVILTAEGRIDQPEEDRIRKHWDQLVGGVKEAFRTMVMGGGLEPKVIGAPVKDVAMKDLMEQCREQICVAFGVPQTLLEDVANRATAQEHRKSLYVETIIPESLLIEEILNEQLFSQLPRPLVLRFQPESLEIMQEEEKDRSEAVLRYVQAGMKLETVIALLGIDIPEGMDITPVATIPAVPAAQIRDWTGDLNLWRKKALRYLEQYDTAVCAFESKEIPASVGLDLKFRLAECETAEQVSFAFATTFRSQEEIEEVKDGGPHFRLRGSNIIMDAEGVKALQEGRPGKENQDGTDQDQI